ncbi:50S ribosomal protein L11 methyltransferase [Streptomyces sp. NPDC001251]|uniref:50S ribosomal protein L11 methyltransferase n=1 Tax=Streptomyces hundungensis TaxID=1077946 RepID=UPI0031E7F3E2
MNAILTPLVTALEELGLAEFLAGFSADSVDLADWARAVDLLDGELRTTAGFLLLGRPAKVDGLPTAVAAALPRLQEYGVALQRDNEAQLVDVSLFRAQGVWLFAEPPSIFQVRHYFGPDSLALARRISYRPDSRVLDLCAGPGFQGLIAAQLGARATLVELLDDVARVAALNAELNGVADRIEVLAGDLYAPLASDGRPFDRVVANIPFLPTPTPPGQEAAEQGGEDGFSVGRRVLEGLPRQLAPHGTAHLTALLFQAGDELLMAKELRDWAETHGCALAVSLTDEMAVDPGSDLVQTAVSDLLDADPGADAQALSSEVAEMFARRGATRARLSYLRIDHGVSGFRILDHSER